MIDREFIRPGSVNGIRALVKRSGGQFAPLPEHYELVLTPFGIVGAIDATSHRTAALNWLPIPDHADITIDLRLDEVSE